MLRHSRHFIARLLPISIYGRIKQGQIQILQAPFLHAPADGICLAVSRQPLASGKMAGFAQRRDCQSGAWAASGGNGGAGSVSGHGARFGDGSTYMCVAKAPPIFCAASVTPTVWPHQVGPNANPATATLSCPINFNLFEDFAVSVGNWSRGVVCLKSW